jgi:nucleoside-diphosphate-sugar epimerase
MISTVPAPPSRVLVTGASGFIGSALVRRLVADGHEVHALTSAVSSVYPQRLLDVRDAVVLHEASLTDRCAMDALVAAARPEVVFHLGAYTHVGKSWSRVDECVATNIQGTINLLQALDRSGWPARRFVFTSTSEVYGDVPVPFVEDGPTHPISPYSVSKHAAERYCDMFVQGKGWPIVMLRPFNAYGPRQSPDRVIPEIITRALRRRAPRLTQGFTTREFVYVDDLADGFVRAGLLAGEEVHGQIVNLCSGREVSLHSLATQVLDLMGNPVRPHFGALPERPTEVPRLVGDPAKAARLLGWSASVPMADGLRRTIDWYRTELAADRASSFAS